MYNTVEDEVYDGLIRSALEEFVRKEAEKRPADDAIAAQYPAQRKDLKRYIRKAKYAKLGTSAPVFYLKRVAIVALVLISAFCTLLLTNVKVRATVVEMFVSWYEEYAGTSGRRGGDSETDPLHTGAVTDTDDPEPLPPVVTDGMKTFVYTPTKWTKFFDREPSEELKTMDLLEISALVPETWSVYLGIASDTSEDGNVFSVGSGYFFKEVREDQWNYAMQSFKDVHTVSGTTDSGIPYYGYESNERGEGAKRRYETEITLLLPDQCHIVVYLSLGEESAHLASSIIRSITVTMH